MTRSEFGQARDGTLHIRTTKRGHDVLDDALLNKGIQAAARDHSDYMSRTGDFGHFEPDPERKTPGDRMRRRGYFWGASENCHMGGGDPMGAHIGWLHSSGHHRNILMEGHREMASGLSGPYWTQNFGAGRDFEAEL